MHVAVGRGREYRLQGLARHALLSARHDAAVPSAADGRGELVLRRRRAGDVRPRLLVVAVLPLVGRAGRVALDPDVQVETSGGQGHFTAPRVAVVVQREAPGGQGRRIGGRFRRRDPARQKADHHRQRQQQRQNAIASVLHIQFLLNFAHDFFSLNFRGESPDFAQSL